MGRQKTLMTLEYKEVVARDLQRIKNSPLVIKLKAIYASLVYPEKEVAKVFDISRSTLSRWIKSYNQHGVEGLIPKQRGHNPAILSKTEKEKIKEWILSCKTDDGKPIHWTLRRLIAEIKKIFNKQITQTPLWLTLISMGLSLKKPRPEHHKSSAEKQEDFKKNSNNY